MRPLLARIYIVQCRQERPNTAAMIVRLTGQISVAPVAAVMADVPKLTTTADVLCEKGSPARAAISGVGKRKGRTEGTEEVCGDATLLNGQSAA